MRILSLRVPDSRLLSTIGLAVSLTGLLVGCAPQGDSEPPSRQEPAAEEAASASFMGLGFLADGSSSNAYGVSSDGQTAVGSGNSGEHLKAFHWTSASGMQSLGEISVDLPNSEAFGVSADGSVIVGDSSNDVGQESAFRWTEAGGMEVITGGGDTIVPAFARSVSADGNSIVGSGLDTDTGTSVPFLWTASGGFTNLADASASADSGIAEGISADGTVVVGINNGSSEAQPLAFRWLSATGMTSLQPVSGATSSNAEAVSALLEVVVGNSNSTGSKVEATYWGSDLQPVGMGYLTQTGLRSQAMAVSADGSVIVGFSQDEDNTQYAFIWDADSGMRNLQTVLQDLGLSSELAGWTLWTALGVSADGRVIVGTGTNSEGNNEAYIATLP